MSDFVLREILAELKAIRELMSMSLVYKNPGNSGTPAVVNNSYGWPVPPPVYSYSPSTKKETLN